jgi:hypothetical protein
VKPLIEVGVAVFVDGEPDVRRIRAIQARDIAGIEIAADPHRRDPLPVSQPAARAMRRYPTISMPAKK